MCAWGQSIAADSILQQLVAPNLELFFWGGKLWLIDLVKYVTCCVSAYPIFIYKVEWNHVESMCAWGPSIATESILQQLVAPNLELFFWGRKLWSIHLVKYYVTCCVSAYPIFSYKVEWNHVESMCSWEQSIATDSFLQPCSTQPRTLFLGLEGLIDSFGQVCDMLCECVPNIYL